MQFSQLIKQTVILQMTFLNLYIIPIFSLYIVHCTLCAAHLMLLILRKTYPSLKKAIKSTLFISAVDIM